MDYIRRFDIVLDRDYYYAGETLKGNIVVENMENIKVRGEVSYCWSLTLRTDFFKHWSWWLFSHFLDYMALTDPMGAPLPLGPFFSISLCFWGKWSTYQVGLQLWCWHPLFGKSWIRHFTVSLVWQGQVHSVLAKIENRIHIQKCFKPSVTLDVNRFLTQRKIGTQQCLCCNNTTCMMRIYKIACSGLTELSNAPNSFSFTFPRSGDFSFGIRLLGMMFWD